MSLADILTALLVISLVVTPTWLALRWARRAVARKRARPVEPETHGDDGGRAIYPRKVSRDDTSTWRPPRRTKDTTRGG